MLTHLLLALALGDPLFVDVSERALPGVRTTCGSRAKDYILEVNGGGLVVEDFDRDGALDLVVIDGSTLERVRAGEPGFPPRLFLGDGKGRLAPAGEAWSMQGGRWGMGGAAGDVDADGFPDLFVTEWGPDRLFRNRDGRGFEEITARAGLVGERWGTSAAFLDFDGDGLLDLAVVNYLVFDPATVPPPGGGCTWKGHPVMCGPEGLVPVHDQLYRGKGDGSFEEVSAAVGFRPDVAGYGLGLTTLDYDLDGRTDLYVANDSTPNHLWENQGGRFVEVGYRRGVSHDPSGKEQAGMGIGCGDVDGDGRPDLLVTNFSGESNSYYASAREKGFRERSSASGLGGPSLRLLGWGTGLFDLDLDGDLDAFVLNGHVYPQADRAGTDTSYAQEDQLYRNDGAGRFVAEPLYAGAPLVSRAGVAADLDGDGDLDIVFLELDGAVRVLENRASHGEGSRWLRVRLEGAGGNRAGLGARVLLELEGGKRLVSEIRGSAGFQAGQPAEAHFGLGAAKAERLVVRWPSGREQVLGAPPVDSRITLREPSE